MKYEEKFSIALIGRTQWAITTCKLLKENGFKIKLIITSKNSDYDPITPKDLKKFADEINSKFIVTERINSIKIINQLKKLKIDLGISTNNRLILSKEIISLFKYGILNAHAGDLPRYRGNASTNWAIIKGEKKIGLTIHFMNEKLDAGNMIKKVFFKIDDHTTIGDVYKFLDKQIPILHLESAKKIRNGKYKIMKQNEKQVLRTYPRNKIDAKINWNMKVDYIHKLIRASGFPFLGAYTYLDSNHLTIIEAKKEYPKFKYFSEPGQITERRKNGEVSIACDDGFLILTKVKFKGKIYENPSKVIKSLYTRLGMDIEMEIEKIYEKLNKIERKLGV